MIWAYWLLIVRKIFQFVDIFLGASLLPSILLVNVIKNLFQFILAAQNGKSRACTKYISHMEGQEVYLRNEFRYYTQGARAQTARINRCQSRYHAAHCSTIFQQNIEASVSFLQWAGVIKFGRNFHNKGLSLAFLFYILVHSFQPLLS